MRDPEPPAYDDTAAESGRARLIEFLMLRRDKQADHWTFAAQPRFCSGDGRLFGGVGVAAAVAAAEATVGAPLNWASARFLRPIGVGEAISISVDTTDDGRRVTQARVVTNVHGRPAVEMLCALGANGSSGHFVSVSPADVPPPDECPPRQYRHPAPDSIATTLDVRVAPLLSDERPRTTVLWARIPDLVEPSAGLMAILADHVPFAVMRTHPDVERVSSIDNGLRIVQRRFSPWTQLDVSVDAIAGGLAHGSVRVWSQDGQLLALAAQTVLVRDDGSSGQPPAESSAGSAERSQAARTAR
jgi:acyl-CoA thioesterase-2